MAQHHVRDLDRKLDLLRKSQAIVDAAYAEGLSTGTLDSVRFGLRHARDEGKRLDPSNFSNAGRTGNLSLLYVSSMLRHFGLSGVPDLIAPSDRAHATWIDLLAEPIDAFKARVRLMGGDVPGESVGALWNNFLDERAPSADREGALRVSVLAPGRQRGSSHERALPDGLTNPIRTAPQALTPVYHKERVHFTFAVGGVLAPRTNRTHVFAFHDVQTAGGHRYVPMYPGPNNVEDDTLLEGAFLQIPGPPGESAGMQIPDNWGELRQLIVVLSRAALDREVLADRHLDAELSAERLDLLAARLSDKTRHPHGSYAVWRYRYLALPSA